MDTNENIEELFSRHRTKMLRLAGLLLRDEAAAEDVVSEVFLSVVSSPPKPQNIEGFLLTAVRNRSISLLRTRKKSVTIPLERSAAEPIAPETGALEERLQEIERFIEENLTEQTRRVLNLRFKEKRKYAEISAELQISEAAVYKHLTQGLEKLRKRFNP